MFKKIFLTIAVVFLPAFARANVITSCVKQIKEGNIVQAIALGKLAVVEHSNNPASYLCLAAAYAKDKHYNFAKVELEEALTLAHSQNLKSEIQMLAQRIQSKKATKKTITASNNSNS